MRDDSGVGIKSDLPAAARRASVTDGWPGWGGSVGVGGVGGTESLCPGVVIRRRGVETEVGGDDAGLNDLEMDCDDRPPRRLNQ